MNRFVTHTWRCTVTPSILGLLCATTYGQSFRSTEGNTYSGRSTTGQRENACVSETTIERRLRVSRDEGAQRLIFIMDIDKVRDAVYRGNSDSMRSECDPGRERSTATIRFYVSDENKSSTDYTGTVISASKSVYGFKLGERIDGRVEVFDGGRGLDFSSEEFSDGVARVLANSFRNAVGPEQGNFVPPRSPDVVLNCRVIASDGTGTASNSDSSSQGVDSSGRTSTWKNSATASSTTSSCLSHGWQDIRKTISVWLNEKRCDGQVCEITPTYLRWGNINLSRVSGQMKDSCYTYECEKAPSTQTRF